MALQRRREAVSTDLEGKQELLRAELAAPYGSKQSDRRVRADLGVLSPR